MIENRDDPRSATRAQCHVRLAWNGRPGLGGRCLEVTAGPAQGFYERTGFYVVGNAQTRFGPAVLMRREIGT